MFVAQREAASYNSGVNGSHEKFRNGTVGRIKSPLEVRGHAIGGSRCCGFYPYDSGCQEIGICFHRIRVAARLFRPLGRLARV